MAMIVMINSLAKLSCQHSARRPVRPGPPERQLVPSRVCGHPGHGSLLAGEVVEPATVLLVTLGPPQAVAHRGHLIFAPPLLRGRGARARHRALMNVREALFWTYRPHEE